MADIQNDPGLLRKMELSRAGLMGSSFNVIFNAKERAALESALGLGPGGLIRVEQSVKSAVRHLIPIEKQARYGTFESRTELSVGVRDLSKEQREYLLGVVTDRIQSIVEMRDRSGEIVEPPDDIKEMLQRYAKVGFGPPPRPTSSIGLPAGFNERDIRSLRNKLRSAYGTTGKVEDLIKDDGVRYIPGAMSAVTGVRGGHIRLSEAIKSAIKDVSAEKQQRTAEENVLLTSAFPDDPVPEEGDPRRATLLTEAAKIERTRRVSAMSDAQAASAATARVGKTLRVQTATELALQSRAIAAGFNETDPHAAAAFAAMNNITANEWNRISPALRNEIVKRRAINRLENTADDEDYIRRKELLTLAVKESRSRAKDEYYTTGPGADTEEGRRYRYNKQRRQENEDMRGAGRVGRILRKLGVGSKTAGRVGRIFGKVGAAAMIVAAIVGLGKLLYGALSKLTAEMVKVGAMAMGQYTASLMTGTSRADIALYNTFRDVSKARGAEVDYLGGVQTVAQRLANIVTNGAGFTDAVKASAFISAASGRGGVNNVVELMNRSRSDVSAVTADLTIAALAGIRSKRSLWARGEGTEQGSLMEFSSYMDAFGMGDTIRNLYALLQNDKDAMAKLDAGIARGDSSKILLHELMRAIEPGAAVAEMTRGDAGLQTASKDLASATLTMKTSFEQLRDYILQNMYIMFGPRLLSIMEGFQQLMLRLLTTFGGVLGINMRPLIARHNEAILTRINERIAENVQIAPQMRESAVNDLHAMRTFSRYFTPGTRTISPGAIDTWLEDFRKTGAIPQDIQGNPDAINRFTRNMIMLDAARAVDKHTAELRKEQSRRHDPNKLRDSALADTTAQMVTSKLITEYSSAAADTKSNLENRGALSATLRIIGNVIGAFLNPFTDSSTELNKAYNTLLTSELSGSAGAERAKRLATTTVPGVVSTAEIFNMGQAISNSIASTMSNMQITLKEPMNVQVEGKFEDINIRVENASGMPVTAPNTIGTNRVNTQVVGNSNRPQGGR